MRQIVLLPAICSLAVGALFFGVFTPEAMARAAPPGAVAVAAAGAPLPDASALLHQVEANQQALEKARELYTFRSLQTIRQLDKSGKVKRTEMEEDEVFFVNGHRIEKVVSRDGKKLSPAEAQKEDAKVAKEVEKASKPGYVDPDRDDVTVSRLLQIIDFSNGRRIRLNGRDTIAYDFLGNPHAKTHGRNEEALKKVSGSVWIDEHDREVSRMDATLDSNYHIGFGLLANVAKGSTFVFSQRLIHGEAWLPTAIEIHLQGKALLLVGLRVDIGIQFDDYRKFEAQATQEPGATVTTSPNP